MVILLIKISRAGINSQYAKMINVNYTLLFRFQNKGAEIDFKNKIYEKPKYIVCLKYMIHINF